MKKVIVKIWFWTSVIFDCFWLTVLDHSLADDFVLLHKIFWLVLFVLGLSSLSYSGIKYADIDDLWFDKKDREQHIKMLSVMLSVAIVVIALLVLFVHTN